MIGDFERVSRRELGQVAIHRRIEIELALFDELHDRQVGEKLGNRADPVDRLGRGRNAMLRRQRTRIPRAQTIR